MKHGIRKHGKGEGRKTAHSPSSLHFEAAINHFGAGDDDKRGKRDEGGRAARTERNCKSAREEANKQAAVKTCHCIAPEGDALRLDSERGQQE